MQHKKEQGEGELSWTESFRGSHDNRFLYVWSSHGIMVKKDI